MVWNLKKNLTNSEKNLLVWAVYIPLSMVELEMLELDADNKHVILTGDFNARTGTDLEFFDKDNARNDQFVEIFETMENELPLLTMFWKEIMKTSVWTHMETFTWNL